MLWVSTAKLDTIFLKCFWAWKSRNGFSEISNCTPYWSAVCNYLWLPEITASGTKVPLPWRHNERDGFSNHQCLDCLLNCLFRRRLKKTSKLRATGLCEGKSPVTGESIPCTKGQCFHSMTSSGSYMYMVGRCDLAISVVTLKVRYS